MVESAREVNGSVRMGGKLVMKRQKKDMWKHTEKRKVKSCIYQNKRKVNEQF